MVGSGVGVCEGTAHLEVGTLLGELLDWDATVRELTLLCEREGSMFRVQDSIKYAGDDSCKEPTSQSQVSRG